MAGQRQQDRSRATRTALIATARELFTEHGYANVPAEDIVARAGLTRGALYHHFQDKQGLFKAVFLELEDELAERIRAAMADSDQPVLAALDAFLSACEEPAMVRIGLTDAPAVLGWAAWREIEAEHGFGLIVEFLQTAGEAGLLVTDKIDVVARLLLSASIEAALVIANAEDRPKARAEAREALLVLMSGLADQSKFAAITETFGPA